jgi:putative membrane protein
MTLAAGILVGMVAVLHVGFLVLEMFYWDRPLGRRIFHTTPDFSRASAVLAANQGLYNGFLAAGLVWGLVSGQVNVILFFLICVLIAGLYGGFTVGRRILYIQALPATIALLFTMYFPR